MDTPATVRYYRQERALTVRELSRRSGIPESTIRDVEAGRVSPRVATLRPLYDALDVPPERRVV